MPDTLTQALPESFQLGSMRIFPNMVLAPMAGVTDSVFRRLVLSLGGCGLVVSEMTNAASVSPKAMKRHRLLDYLPEERPISIQLSGNDPDLVATAARFVEELGPDVIDINCGCPSPKVTGGGHGSALLKDLPKMQQMLKAVYAAINIPFTLKFRAGWDAQSLNYIDTAKIAEDAGCAAITLHPRTKVQGYSGDADWSRVAEVVQAVSIPVIGSGDVRTPADALARLEQTGVAAVMIGRAAMANPWIFRQIAQLRAGEPMFVPTPSDKRDLLVRYVDMCAETMVERQALGKLKQLIGQFSIGLYASNQLRRDVQRANEIEAAKTIIANFFEPFISGAVEAVEVPDEIAVIKEGCENGANN